MTFPFLRRCCRRPLRYGDARDAGSAWSAVDGEVIADLENAAAIQAAPTAASCSAQVRTCPVSVTVLPLASIHRSIPVDRFPVGFLHEEFPR
jgi:hypothetical protein